MAQGLWTCRRLPTQEINKMPHQSYTSHLVERQRMLSDLRKVLIPADLPMVCRVCFTVQEDDDRCLCDLPAWVPFEAVLHELNYLIETLQEQRPTLTEEKVA